MEQQRKIANMVKAISDYCEAARDIESAYQQETISACLVEIEWQAEEMFSRLVKQIAEHEGVTEALKSQDQMEWTGRMNNLRERATEIVNNDLIYN